MYYGYGLGSGLKAGLMTHSMAICPMNFWFWSYYLDKLLLVGFVLLSLRLLYELFIGYYYSSLKLRTFVFGSSMLLVIVSAMLYMPLLGLILTAGVLLPAYLGAMILRKIDSYYSKYYISEGMEENADIKKHRYYKNWIVFGLICGLNVANHLTVELKILSMILYFLFAGFIYLFGQYIIKGAKKKYIHESLGMERSGWCCLSGVIFVLFIFSALAWVLTMHCGCYKIVPSMSYEALTYSMLK